MGKEVNIYAILVSYNAMQWVDRCLGSLLQSTVPISIIVVDNKSTDSTVTYIQEEYKNVILLPQEENLGFGQANNVGIRYAMQHGCTHILLLNQDAWIDSDMVEKLLAYDDEHSLLSPIHLTGDGKKIDHNFYCNAILHSKEFNRYKTEQALGIHSKYATDKINAACWLLPRKILEEIGGFNPLFFHYAEDDDYLQRLHYHGKKVYFVSGTFCYHDREFVRPKDPSKQSIYQHLVLRTVDINHSLFLCSLFRWRYSIAVWHNALIKHRLRDICLLYQAKRNLCKNYKVIKENRLLLTSIGAHWLT